MRPIVLAILDGWGYSNKKVGNAILGAQTPNIHQIEANYPSILLQASGKPVGLEWGESGNSEVGHLTIGAGRIIFQYSSRINRAIENGSFFENPTLAQATSHTLEHQSSLHLVGLLGSGTVHSSFNHLTALIRSAKEKGITKLYLHLFGDGKDSGLKEAPQTLLKLEGEIQKFGVGKLATFMGRNVAMDRDNNWNLTEKAYKLLVHGEGEKVTNLSEAITAAYNKGLNDSTLPTMVLDEAGLIKDNDAVVFFNFREDSIRQIASTFVEEGFNKFVQTRPQNLFVVLMTQYFDTPGLHIAFPMPEIKYGLAEYISALGKTQLHVAETQKYAHVTYFFNCLKNGSFPGEQDLLVESHKATKEHPEMKAAEVADTFLEQFRTNTPEFTVLNFANADILSHAGSLDLAIIGCGHIDTAIGRVKEAILAQGGVLLITSDHGNSESLVYKSTGDTETKHNPNPVPFYLIAQEYERPRSLQEVEQTRKNIVGILADVAPTVLALMNTQQPLEMTGTSLLQLLS